jgi:hypothetical protein
LAQRDHTTRPPSPVGATKKPLHRAFSMGGTGLEPVTPSLSIRGGRSRSCAPVRLTRMAPRNPVAVFGPQRTRANVRCSHRSHAHSSGFIDRAAQRVSRTPHRADVLCGPRAPAGPVRINVLDRPPPGEHVRVGLARTSHRDFARVIAFTLPRAPCMAESERPREYEVVAPRNRRELSL